MFKNMSRDQKVLLAVLTLINLLNYLDRQVIFSLFTNLKIAFNLSDLQLGALGTAFLLVQSMATLPLGILADRMSRKVIISVGITFWSVMSFASGLAGSFGALLGIRSLVGVGEASYAPAAVSMITDNFPPEANSQVQGMFNIGMLVGGTIGAVVGGIVAFYTNNWRLAFFIVSIPGFILAYLVLRVKDVRVKHDEPKVPIRSLMENAAFVWIIISGAFVSFASGAFISWGIEFITRYKDYNVLDASVILGVGMMIASIIGVLAGSYAADALHKKYAWGRSFVVAISLMIAAPLMYAGLETSGGLFLFFFFTGAIFLAVYLGPVTSVLHDVVPKQFRATAFGIYVLFIHLLGEAFSPSIVGLVSDHTNLRTALALTTILVFVSGICFLPVTYLIAKKNKQKDQITFAV